MQFAEISVELEHGCKRNFFMPLDNSWLSSEMTKPRQSFVT